MDDLIAFLRARLGEDERVARSATDGPWIDEFSRETGHCVIPADAANTREYVARTQLLAALPDAQHIARHDPARVLRDVASKRRIADEMLAECDAGDLDPWRGIYGKTFRLLALPYEDHEDFREEWRP